MLIILIQRLIYNHGYQSSLFLSIFTINAIFVNNSSANPILNKSHKPNLDELHQTYPFHTKLSLDSSWKALTSKIPKSKTDFMNVEIPSTAHFEPNMILSINPNDNNDTNHDSISFTIKSNEYKLSSDCCLPIKYKVPPFIMDTLTTNVNNHKNEQINGHLILTIFETRVHKENENVIFILTNSSSLYSTTCKYQSSVSINNGFNIFISSFFHIESFPVSLHNVGEEILPETENNVQLTHWHGTQRKLLLYGDAWKVQSTALDHAEAGMAVGIDGSDIIWLIGGKSQPTGLSRVDPNAAIPQPTAVSLLTFNIFSDGMTKTKLH